MCISSALPLHFVCIQSQFRAHFLTIHFGVIFVAIWCAFALPFQNWCAQGSLAYARALEKCGLVSPFECKTICAGLIEIQQEWTLGKFELKNDEDIHSANERRLKEIIGKEVGGKLHVGRSRNDQVATDVRIWLREKAVPLRILILSFIKICYDRAKREIDVLIPGYTHLQRAQPIRWSHLLLSYAWYLHNDAVKLEEIISHLNVLPLGSGALAGNPFNIDRDCIAQELGFRGCIQNSIVGVSDRDFVADFLFWTSLTAVHLSKVAEDLILYSTKEFGFITISDSFSTGSSLMPQKKNADGLELIRGKVGRIIGHCVGFLIVLKGLPSSFNRDLQEDKEALFDSYKTIVGMLEVACGTIETLQVNEDICQCALSEELLSTDIAYYLVRKGESFRNAHKLAGEVVALAEKLKCKMTELPLKLLNSISKFFEKDVFEIWDYEKSVEQYQELGGTSKAIVELQLGKLEKWLLENQTIATKHI